MKQMLPGVSMSVAQEIGSRQGIRERFATQRDNTLTSQYPFTISMTIKF